MNSRKGKKNEPLNPEMALETELIFTISETNGISLQNTLELMHHSPTIRRQAPLAKKIQDFEQGLSLYNQGLGGEESLNALLEHSIGQSLFKYFQQFPKRFYEEHIHLTGSLSAQFLFPRLKKILEGPLGPKIAKKIETIYGSQALPIESVEQLHKLISLNSNQGFHDYLKILFIPKLVLINKDAHSEAAYSLAQELYEHYNIGHIRLKFTLSRATTNELEQIPGLEHLTEEDVVLGLYQGLEQFRTEHPDFDYVLCPCFRKESNFYNAQKFSSKKDHFMAQVESLLEITRRHPYLKDKLTEVDTVGDEADLYRKAHFLDMRTGLRRLQYNGFKIKSHHGETWRTLKKGIQAIDNAMNIWHLDTIEHGLGLGINPNFYFHRLYQRVMDLNQQGQSISIHSLEGQELSEMEWTDTTILPKLFHGQKLSNTEHQQFIKSKFYTAREVEHYQHDVLNRMIHKNVSLVSLPSSNMKLTNNFPDFKGHPFSWWEKKGVGLGVGTDNYVTLQTNPIRELLMLLFSDPENLKITKLLMVATRETRRPYLAHLLWEKRTDLT